jgi:hypothetical protein
MEGLLNIDLKLDALDCFCRMYPPGGFTSFLQSNCSPENSHLVGNTGSRATISPSTPSFRGTPVGDSNAQDKETINVDEEYIAEDGRTKKRLNWTKDEDIRLVSNLS